MVVDVERRLEGFRPRLTGHCTRMLGPSDAEDAVQETFVRAWRSFDRFEGRSELGTWLHAIATNVCLDMLQGRQRRPRLAEAPLSALPEPSWAVGEVVASHDHDPAELTASRETIRHVFVAALLHLPPRQRAVLILRDVLRWRAGEVADLLGTTVAAVNSALQRARATLAARPSVSAAPGEPEARGQRSLVDRYVDAFADFDVDRLTRLLHEDAVA